MIINKRLKYIRSVNALDFYLYKPTLGHWFFSDWKGYEEDTEKHSLRQKVRMFLEWIWGGYYVYYAAINNDVIGYVTVASGGRRIVCSKKTDIVLGPYYTLKEKRGMGYMPLMINGVLNDPDINYESAYCYIKKDNTPSIKVASKCGFEMIGQADIRGILRKLYISENDESRFYIYQYK